MQDLTIEYYDSESDEGHLLVLAMELVESCMKHNMRPRMKFQLVCWGEVRKMDKWVKDLITK